MKEETFNGETGVGYKDGERRGENDGDREEVFDSDDEDSEFRGEGKVSPCGKNKKFFCVGRGGFWQGLGLGPPFKLIFGYTTGLTLRKLISITKQLCQFCSSGVESRLVWLSFSLLAE